MIDLTNATPRRGFLGRLATIAAPIVGYSLFGTRDLAAAVPRPGSGPDMGWLDNLKGKHKTAFDADNHKNGAALVQAKNFLDAWQNSFGVPQSEVNLIMAVRGTGIPLVLTDEMWAKYKIGEQYGITDPATKAPSVRNLYIDANLQVNGPVNKDQTVEALRKRGVVFLICMNTIAGATKKLVAAGMGTSEQVHGALVNGIIPGVIKVPAMVVAFTQMQERHVAYVYAG
ncbi:MAG TPA: hypothetical protein VG432_16970 [Gemmatimonadaceae bacterium]|nr:hypothetical protein [Gemmatimonadaceae bacterium]